MKVVLLKLPSTGSTMLGRVIAQHSSIDFRWELLNSRRMESAENKVTIANSLLNETDVPCKGISLRPSYVGLGYSDLCRIASGSVIIVLTRNDLLRQAISIQRRKAILRKGFVWLSNPKASKLKVRINIKMLKATIAQLQCESSELIKISKSLNKELGCPVLHLTYEDDILVLEDSIEKILNFMGQKVPPNFDLAAGTIKATPENFWSVIKNVNQVKRFCKGRE